MGQGKTQKTELEIPPFDDSILLPSDDEVVRAVRTIPNQEKNFAAFCQRNGVVVYLPLRKTWKFHNVHGNGRSYNYSREVLRPLFTSYVFVKVARLNLRDLFESRLVTKILQPPDQEKFIDELRIVRTFETVGFEEGLEVHREIVPGDRFVIMSGVWEGSTGWLSSKDGLFKWTVKIEIANQYVTTYLDPTQFKMQRLDA